MDWVNYNFVFVFQVYLLKSRADSPFYKGFPASAGHHLKPVQTIANSGEWPGSRRSNMVVLSQSTYKQQRSFTPTLHAFTHFP